MQVTELNEKYLNAEASRTLLLAQTNELIEYKREMEETVQRADPARAYADTMERKKLAEELEELRTELEALQARYKSVVPMPEHAVLQERCTLAEQRVLEQAAEIQELRQGNAELTEAHSRGVTINKHLETRLQSFTPRPDWSQCEELFGGWSGAVEGLESAEKLLFLIEQTEKALNSGPVRLDGRGKARTSKITVAPTPKKGAAA